MLIKIWRIVSNDKCLTSCLTKQEAEETIQRRYYDDGYDGIGKIYLPMPKDAIIVDPD